MPRRASLGDDGADAASGGRPEERDEAIADPTSAVEVSRRGDARDLDLVFRAVAMERREEMRECHFYPRLLSLLDCRRLVSAAADAVRFRALHSPGEHLR